MQQTSPELKIHPKPSRARTLLWGELLRLPLRHKVRLARLACSSVLRRSVSSGKATQGELPFPPLSQRLMRLVLLARGLTDRNELGKRTMGWCANRLQQRLERDARPVEPTPVPVFEWSPGCEEEFYHRHVRPQRPAVIKGVPSRAGHWSVDWLVRNYGEEPLTLIDASGASFEGRIHDLEGSAPDGGPYYMHNHFRLLRDWPELRADLGLEVLGELVRRKDPNTVSMFASVKPGTGALMHCANNMNTFRLLEGRKRWTLIDPNYFLLAYPFLSHTNIFQLSLVLDAEEDGGLPLFRHCPRYMVDLEPGDSLLVPTWWYHSVRNLDARTLAVAVRWPPHALGEVHSNSMFRFLCQAAQRVEPESRGIHQDSTYLVGTGAARASWALDRDQNRD